MEGHILTVTPQEALAYDTRYTLKIPVEALRSSYGHTMDEDYILNFTTTASSPEVIFAYPGDGMENTALNADLRLQFNQGVQQGPNFADIALYRSDSVEIPATVSLQNQWIYIHPAGSLNKNTAYSLLVPRAAVINEKGVAQREDYMLAFTTENPGGGDDDKPSDRDRDKTRRSEPGTYSTIVVIGGSSRNLAVLTGQEGAIVSLEGLAEEIFAGDENVVINMPDIPGVTAYMLEKPAASLTGPYGKASLVLNTKFGSVIIPSGMLREIPGLEGKTAGILIAEGDRAELPDYFREALGNRPLIQLALMLDGKETYWNNPAAPITVSIPYTPTEEEIANAESIVLWYIDGSGNVVCIPNGRYDLPAGTVTFTTTHFSHFAVGYNKVSFNDVSEAEWYNKAVSFIAARNITQGTGNGNFRPDGKLTRGQFIVMLMKTYGMDPDAYPTDNFADAGNTYYTGYIAAAKRRGISNGIGNNLFAPEKEITRQEMFTLLCNALKVIDQLPEGDFGKTLFDFTDAGEIDSWAMGAMALLVETGTIVGNAGRLDPKSTTTRAEMAQVLYNLLSK